MTDKEFAALHGVSTRTIYRRPELYEAFVKQSENLKLKNGVNETQLAADRLRGFKSAYNLAKWQIQEAFKEVV